MNKYYLFSYGTLMNEEVQSILFGRVIKMLDAELENYKIYSDIDGYFYVKEEEGSSVQGKILELTEDEIWIADQWEEVPSSLYLREKVYVKDSNEKSIEVFLYIKNNVKAMNNVKKDSISSTDFHEVISSVKKFKDELDSTRKL